MSADEGLRASGVTVRFGSLTALDGALLAVPPGTVTGLVGPGGAGKTALLDVICGLRRPARGEIRLDGRDLAGAPAHARARLGVARTFQRPRAFGTLTVRQNVRLAAEARAMTRPVAGRTAADRFRRRRAAVREAAREADALLDRVGVAGYADAVPARLPAGAVRLMELARALATRPRVLLLDDPSAGLPVPESRALEVLLRDLAAEGLAVLLAEREPDRVMGVCDELYVLRSGRTVTSGPPFQVRAALRDRETAPAAAH
ncbi:ABC transporter ATP-binding protein [Actinomadura viridis]|uniref:ABC-type branched-subunit amino acid transport system ATPase component n=1 Tax=Actinomadura viridis TaxID=58110 RepID=A0A931DKQ3_9ACTN|nr:ATP-binding cassette domain-containing protein [Actinomadura viridis]MBG6089326.1 ABC-type branched-subunit amino acid transport system ATPase component [Actinomadura viridis]